MPAPRTAHGLTLIELLIAMSISSVLMVGLCAVFNASMNSVRIGNSSMRCTESARQAVSRIVTEVREAEAVQVDPSGASLQVIRPADKRESGEIDRQFTFDAPSRRITMQIFHSDGPNPTYDVAADVSACSFIPIDTATGPDNTKTTSRISVSITCADGVSSFTLAGAASPRNMAYNHGQ